MTDTASQMSSQAASLFQKAHGKIVMLQRLDAQLGSLLEQRKRLQDDLSSVQAQINEEFDRLMRQADEAPNRILAEIADTGRRHNNGPTAIGEPAGRLTEVGADQ
jgi:hypothetical protein